MESREVASIRKMIGKRVLIKYGSEEQSGESGTLLGELDDGYIIKDDYGRIVKAPKDKNHAKIVTFDGEQNEKTDVS